ncbi:MAG: RNA methyltransferase [Bacteroidetes bacterium]|nr:RNA methyltransferase [Bacteroidota bacterium]
MSGYPEKKVSEKRRKEITSLKRSTYRDRHDAFLVEGARSIRAALTARADVLELLIAPSAIDSSIGDEAARAGAQVLSISNRELSRISNVSVSQGLLLVARRKKVSPEEMLIRKSVLILDGIQDPGNVGTLVRTAAWFGVEAVLSGPETADFFNPKVVRSSMGGIWDVDLATSESLSSWISSYRELDARIYAADLSGESVYDWTPAHPSAMVIGSEAHGLSEAVRGAIDSSVCIPGVRRATQSLNASVAGGVIISAWVRGIR